MNYNAAGAHRQGTPATFPGKPTGKAGKQLAAMQDAEDSSSSEEGSSQSSNAADNSGAES